MNDNIISILDQRKAALLEKSSQIRESAKKMIWVTFALEGMHKYPQALEDPALAEVKFLGYPHRHMFHFRVWIQVFHEDRDIEFILFKRWCQSLYTSNNSGLPEGILELNNQSCEMLADQLYSKITDRYPNRDVWVEVSEDGENGCYVEYNIPDTNAPKFKSY
jgi:hypothetical protein